MYKRQGRRNDSSEQIHNWRLEGSNDDSEWTLLRSGNPFTIDSATHQLIVQNNTISYQYYRIFVVEGHGTNPGLSQVQLFVYCLSNAKHCMGQNITSLAACVDVCVFVRARARDLGAQYLENG